MITEEYSGHEKIQSLQRLQETLRRLQESESTNWVLTNDLYASNLTIQTSKNAFSTAGSYTLKKGVTQKEINEAIQDYN